MISISISKKVEQWLDGLLSPEAATAFEAEMLADEALQNEVEVHRRIRQEVEHALYKDYRHKAALWMTELDQLPPPPEGDGAVNLTPEGQQQTGTESDQDPKQEPDKAPLETIPSSLMERELETDSQLKERTSSPQVEASNEIVMHPPKIPDICDSVANQMHEALKTELAGFLGTSLTNDNFGNDVLFQQTIECFVKNDFPQFIVFMHRYLVSGAENNRVLLQRMRADVHYKGGAYNSAATHLERYCRETAPISPEISWLLLHFYLRDYENNKEAFWKLLEEMPLLNNEFQQKAQQLKLRLLQEGFQPD
jgi:hypothetical protein